MRIEDTLDLTRTNNGSYAEHVGEKFISVRDKDVNGLLQLFDEKNIVIDTSNSEKEIFYKILGEEKRSMIPFALDNDFTEVTKYVLNNSNLRIEIGDYSERQKGNPNIAGGSYTVKAGIMCRIMFEGANTDVGMVTQAKEILKDFYRE